jgi:hypothetical protein
LFEFIREGAMMLGVLFEFEGGRVDGGGESFHGLSLAYFTTETQEIN